MNNAELINAALVIEVEMSEFQQRLADSDVNSHFELAKVYFRLNRKAKALEGEMMSAGEDPDVRKAYQVFRLKLNKFQRFNRQMRTIVEANSIA